MSHAPGALGSHVVGVPAIFIRSDVLAHYDPQTWDYESPDDGDPVFQRLAAEGTILHELRHFHDALLIPSLFVRFILEVKRNLLAAKILGESKGQQPDLLIPDNASELAQYKEDLAAYKRLNLPGSRKIDIPWLGASVGLSDLLEANAVTTELAFLGLRLGEGEFSAQWPTLLNARPMNYRRIVERMLLPGVSLLASLARLNRLLTTCLYADDEPVRLFARITSAGPPVLDEYCHPKTIASRVQSYWSTHEIKIIEYGYTDQLRRYFLTASEIFDLRERCLCEFAKWQFDLLGYHDHIDDLPIPPTVFFPSDEMVKERTLPFVRKNDLRHKYGDAFSILFRRDKSRRTTLACGIIPTPGFGSWTALNRVDTMLAVRYLSQTLFEERVTYNATLDSAYAGYGDSFRAH